MSEERIEILRMVADKVINVDDAERLLRALGEGEHSREHREHRGHRERRQRREGRHATAAAGAFSGVSSALGAIGEVVQSTVADAMEDVAIDLRNYGTDDDDDGENIAGSEFEMAQGERLVIRRRGKNGRVAKCSLTLTRGDTDRCTVRAKDGSELRIRRKADGATIDWRSGDLVVSVPVTVSVLEAKVAGGDLFGSDLQCAIEADVMGGRMELQRLSRAFDCKTMGGEMQLSLEAGIRGDCRARVMGGSAVLEIADGVDAHITAISTGGEVRTDETFQAVHREGTFQRRIILDVGAGGEEAAEVSVKAMGGDVRIERASR